LITIYIAFQSFATFLHVLFVCFYLLSAPTDNAPCNINGMKFVFPTPHAHQKVNEFGASVFTSSNPLMNLPGRIAPTITRRDGTPAVKVKSTMKRTTQYEENKRAYGDRLENTMRRTPSQSRELSNAGRLASGYNYFPGSVSSPSLGSSRGSSRGSRGSNSQLAITSPYAKPQRKFAGRTCSATIETHAKMGLWSSFTTAATPWQIAPPVNEEEERAKRARALNMVAAAMAGNEAQSSGRIRATKSSADFGGVAVRLASQSFDRRLAMSRQKQAEAALEPTRELTAIEMHEMHEEANKKPWHD